MARALQSELRLLHPAVSAANLALKTPNSASKCWEALWVVARSRDRNVVVCEKQGDLVEKPQVPWPLKLAFLFRLPPSRYATLDESIGSDGNPSKPQFSPSLQNRNLRVPVPLTLFSSALSLSPLTYSFAFFLYVFVSVSLSLFVLFFCLLCVPVCLSACLSACLSMSLSPCIKLNA